MYSGGFLTLIQSFYRVICKKLYGCDLCIQNRNVPENLDTTFKVKNQCHFATGSHCLKAPFLLHAYCEPILWRTLHQLFYTPRDNPMRLIATSITTLHRRKLRLKRGSITALDPKAQELSGLSEACQ